MKPTRSTFEHKKQVFIIDHSHVHDIADSYLKVGYIGSCIIKIWLYT